MIAPNWVSGERALEHGARVWTADLGQYGLGTGLDLGKAKAGVASASLLLVRWRSRQIEASMSESMSDKRVRGEGGDADW